MLSFHEFLEDEKVRSFSLLSVAPMAGLRTSRRAGLCPAIVWAMCESFGDICSSA